MMQDDKISPDHDADTGVVSDVADIPEARTTISQRASRALQPATMKSGEIRELQRSKTSIVTEEQVGDTLRWLAESAAEIGRARQAMLNKKSLLDRTESILFLQAEGSVEYRKHWVKTQDKWMEANDEYAHACGEFERLKALREAASHRIESWRTESASLRQR